MVLNKRNSVEYETLNPNPVPQFGKPRDAPVIKVSEALIVIATFSDA